MDRFENCAEAPAVLKWVSDEDSSEGISPLGAFLMAATELLVEYDLSMEGDKENEDRKSDTERTDTKASQ